LPQILSWPIQYSNWLLQLENRDELEMFQWNKSLSWRSTKFPVVQEVNKTQRTTAAGCSLLVRDMLHYILNQNFQIPSEYFIFLKKEELSPVSAIW